MVRPKPDRNAPGKERADSSYGGGIVGHAILRHHDRRIADVTIDYPGSSVHPDRIVFGVESIGQAVTVTLFSAVGRATIVGTGNGRYEVH